MPATELAPDTTPLNATRTSLMGKAAEILAAGAQCEDLERLSAANLLIEQALGTIKGNAPPSVAPMVSQISFQVEDLKQKTSVVVVGGLEAERAGVAIPEKYSVKALLAKDPYDTSKKVAETHGLGFDSETNRWFLVRMGVVPGSLGLSREQRVALPQHEFEGLKTGIPATESDSRACYRVANKIVQSGEVTPRPFTGVYAATDWNSVSGCRFVFGNSLTSGVISLHFKDRDDPSRVGAASFAN